jgi:high frequency lysogenization protein
LQTPDARYRNIALALAGVAQAIAAMNQLARSGELNRQDLATSVNSLFEQNPSDVESVFGGIDRVEPGLTLLIELLKNRSDAEHATIINYCLGIFHLQKKLSGNRAMLADIGDRLDQARHKLKHFGAMHEQVISHLATIYTDTISTFSFRIQVVGEYQYLQQQRIADQIRVLLLGAIRAATLWRQVGGNRLQLYLYRAKILAAAEALRAEIQAKIVH